VVFTTATRRHGDTVEHGVALSAELNRLGTEILDAAFSVHRELGPGLLESVYEACLCRELNLRRLWWRQQVPVPIVYKGEAIDGLFGLDFLVEESVIIELKSVENILPVHKAHLPKYLKLTDIRLGYILNFNVPMLRDGIKRIVR